MPTNVGGGTRSTKHQVCPAFCPRKNPPWTRKGVTEGFFDVNAKLALIVALRSLGAAAVRCAVFFALHVFEAVVAPAVHVELCNLKLTADEEARAALLA